MSRRPAALPRRPSSRLRLAPSHRIEFYRQMDTLLSSGVLIADALRRLRDRYPDRRTRRILSVVHAEVTESRMSLSRALSLFPRSFPSGAVAADAGEIRPLSTRLYPAAANIIKRRDLRQAALTINQIRELADLF